MSGSVGSRSNASRTSNGSQHHHHHPHAKYAPKNLGGGESTWEKVRDDDSGADYFVNRLTRATTWTDRTKEKSAKVEG